MCSIKYFWLLLKWTFAPDLQLHILQGSPTISFPPNMENSSNTSLGRLLIIHLAQQYQNVGNLPLWIQNSRVPHLCILVYTRRRCWQCSVVGGFYKPWLYKEGIRRKNIFFLPIPSNPSESEGGMIFHCTFNMKLCKDFHQNDSAHQYGSENWLRFPDAPYLTTLAEQVTSPLEEAVLQVSFPHSLAGAILVVRIVVIFPVTCSQFVYRSPSSWIFSPVLSCFEVEYGD